MKREVKRFGFTPDFERIPEQLKRLDRWVCWKAKPKKHGKAGKQPTQPNGINASSVSRATWSSFQACKGAFEKDQLINRFGFDGVGFVVTGRAGDDDKDKPHDHDLTFIDLDDCYNEIDGPDDWAQAIIDAANTYVEVSPSGRGLRLVLEGSPVEELINNAQGLEVYPPAARRYVTMTGRTPSMTNNVRDEINDTFPNALVDLLESYRKPTDGAEYAGDPVSDSPEQIERILTELVEREPEMNGYEPWLQLGMALHHQFNGDYEGLEIWDRVSSLLPDYDRDELEYKYSTFGTGGGRHTTLRSMFEKAKNVGVSVRAQSLPATAEDFPLYDDQEHNAYEGEPERVSMGPDELGMTFGHAACSGKLPVELVEDTIALGEVVGIAGQPGAMKTLTTIDLCWSLTKAFEAGENGEWFNLKVRPTGVLWLAYEGKGAVEKRLRGYEVVKGCRTPESFALVGPQVYANASGSAFAEYVEALIGNYERHNGKRPGVIVIDTLAASAPGLKENDSSEMGRLAGIMRTLATRAQMSVLYIHHSTKSGDSWLRGHSGLLGDVDTLLGLTKDADTKVVRIEVAKQRNLGSEGVTHEAAMQIVETGEQRSFGDSETAPVLSRMPGITKTGDIMGEVELDFLEALRDAVRDAGNVGLDRARWNTFIGRFTDRFDWSDSKQERELRKCRKAAEGEFEFERDGSNKISRITAIRRN